LRSRRGRQRGNLHQAPDENNAQKKRRQPAAKKKSKGGARVSDQGADLHYGKNNNGFPSARLNSKEIEDDPYLLGVSNRFDDEVPSLDPEAVAGRKEKGSFRPPEESENESGEENDENAKIQEELMGHLSQEQRQRVIDHMRQKAADAAQEKAGNPAYDTYKKHCLGDGALDESGEGARDATAPSRGNASGRASIRGNSSGRGASMGNASGRAPRGGSTGSKAPPPRGSNATSLSRLPLRHVPGEESVDENEDPPAEFEDENERLALVLRKAKRKSKNKCLLYCCRRPLSCFIVVIEVVCALVLSRGARFTLFGEFGTVT
jgi:hypothetical protein